MYTEGKETEFNVETEGEDTETKKSHADIVHREDMVWNNCIKML